MLGAGTMTGSVLPRDHWSRLCEELLMPNMDVWDWVLMAGAAYIAVTSLVILMLRRRDEVLAELDAQARIERERRRQEAFDKERQRKKKQAA